MEKKGFSLVELIVSVTILTILSTIGFVSYSSYLGDSRDSQRKSDLAQLGSALKIYKQKRGYFPNPGESFDITYRGYDIVKQGLFNNDVRLNTLDKLPLDPKINKPYIFSISKNAQEYEISMTLENQDKPKAIVNGNYKTVSKLILPSLTLAIEFPSSGKVEIGTGVTNIGGNGDINRNNFILSEQNHNLPYSFKNPFNYKSDGTNLENILLELENGNKFWQNTDYRSCLEIKESGKTLISDGSPVNYQIIDDNGILIDRICSCGVILCTGDPI